MIAKYTCPALTKWLIARLDKPVVAVAAGD